MSFVVVLFGLGSPSIYELVKETDKTLSVKDGLYTKGVRRMDKPAPEMYAVFKTRKEAEAKARAAEKAYEAQAGRVRAAREALADAQRAQVAAAIAALKGERPDVPT